MRLCLIVPAALLASGCGYVGDPLPPALNIPLAVTDLRATQQGDRIVIEFTAPAQTTEALGLRRFGEVDVRAGAIRAGFEINRWASSAKPLQVGGAEPEPGKAVRIEVPAAAWTGREILFAARVSGPSGRFSDWSNTAIVNVRKPLAAPENVRAASHPEGVRLTWHSVPEALEYRIVKRGEAGFAPAGTAQGTEFIDRAAEAGKQQEYAVQAAAGAVEGPVSSSVAITPKDEFPPEAPGGLTAVAGLDSIELAWERNTEADLRSYRVYRATGDGAFSIVAEAVDAPAWSDRRIAAGTGYRYRVTALDRAGNESKPSEAISVTAP